MTFVVTDNCIRCKYTDCVEVCPVDCFYEGPNFWSSILMNVLIVLCEPECPANAIFSEDEVPSGQEEFLKLMKSYPLFGQTSPRKRRPT